MTYYVKVREDNKYYYVKHINGIVVNLFKHKKLATECDIETAKQIVSKTKNSHIELRRDKNGKKVNTART